jgi:hypothetical protein
MRGAGAILPSPPIFVSGITRSMSDTGVCAAGATLLTLDSVDIEVDTWLVTGAALGAM